MSPKTSSKIAKIIIIIASVAALFYFMYWLWQRQPKEQPQPEPQSQNTQNQIVENKNEEVTITTTPADGAIVDNADSTLAIKTKAASFVAIFSNSFSQIAKTDSAGLVTQDEKFDSALNLIQISIFTDDFTKRIDKKIAIYTRNAKTPPSANVVVAGTVKNIFQNVITVDSFGQDNKIKQDSATKINYPTPLPAAKKSATNNQDIRVGDYLIVLGKTGTVDEISALNIDIYRDSKPQIQKDIGQYLLLTPVKNNVFSAKGGSENQISEFTLNKNSQISKGGQTASATDITKGQKALIVFHPEADKKIADLIYLLP